MVPTITPRPFLKEDLYLVSPVYYISKRFSDVRFLARAQPNQGDYETLVKLDKQNIVAFDVSRTGKVAFATDQGLVYAAGHDKPWSAFLKTAPSQQVTQVAWSPDGTSLAFTVRASEADFAKMVRTGTSGVYLWSADGDPRLVIPDKPGKDRQNFIGYSWAPSGKLLLVGFTLAAGDKVEGFGVWNAATGAYGEVYRYQAFDRQHFQSALWARDSQSLYLFASPSADPSEPSTLATLSLDGKLQFINITGSNGIPNAISAIAFIPDGRTVALAAAARNEPMQIFVGRIRANQLDLTPVGVGFKLKYPGVLLTPPTGFPLYIMDQQYGVQLFNSGKTLPFWPQEMRLGSLNNTDAFGDEFFPAWQFGPVEATLPPLS
jgi:WD40 repeat protein